MATGPVTSLEDTDDQIAQLIQNIDIYYDDNAHVARCGPHDSTARQSEQQLLNMPISLPESVEEQHCCIPALSVDAKDTSESDQSHE